MSDCLFCNIIDGTLSSEKVYEDEHIVVFRDIYPKARVHVLVVPRKHIPTANDVREEDEILIGKMLRAAAYVAQTESLEGYKLQMHVGAKGGQEIFHIHLHLLGE
jgi:histidine triad (HIT) family protein